MSSPPRSTWYQEGIGERPPNGFASLEADASPPSEPNVVTPVGIPGDTSHPGSSPWPSLECAPATSRRLANAPAGTRVCEVFLIHELETRGGDTPHTILTFSHAGGRLRSAPFWSSDRHRIANLARGQAVEVTGTIGTWRDRRQLQVESIRALPADQIPWNRLVPSCGDPTPWWRLLDGWRMTVRGPRLAQTLGLLFDDTSFRSRFERCPASLGGHHALLGGLLQHTCEVVHIALAAASIAPRADRDLVLAGALLHDIGKVESYRYEGIFEPTIAGRALGHVVLGCLLLDRAVRSAPHIPCTPAELDLLHHMILAHHGRLEFGAPILPLTLEAELLCHADLASARATSFQDALSDPDLFPPDGAMAARSVWQLDHRRIWRGISDWGRDQPGADRR
jgi:3'-5' exoribonuclease